MYSPPSYSDQENALLSRVVCEFCESRDALVLGDFNLPSIVWTEEGGMLGGIGNVDRMFLDCFALAGLTQWVLEAMFISSGNTLDLFMTSEFDRVGL